MEIKKIPPQVVPYMPVIPGLLIGMLNREKGYYYGVLGSSGVNYINISADEILLTPFLVLQTESFDRIGIYIRTTGTATAARMGIYNDNGQGKPSSLLLDAGTIDVSTTGDKAIAISKALSPGLYWLAILPNGTVSVDAVILTDLIGVRGRSTSMYGGCGTGYYQNYAYNVLPDNLTLTGSMAGVYTIAIALRRA